MAYGKLACAAEEEYQTTGSLIKLKAGALVQEAIQSWETAQCKLEDQEPRAAQHHDVVIPRSSSKLGWPHKRPDQGEVKGVFAFRWSQSPFDPADEASFMLSSASMGMSP